MNKNILAALILTVVIFPTSASSEPASRSSIEKLMSVTGAGHAGVQMLGQMKKMMPGISKELWDKFRAEVKVEELTDQVVPIYQKHLTQEDVDAMNKFYATSTGKKLITVMPAIMQESRIAGQRWGQGVAYKLIQMQQAKSKQK